MSAAGGLVTLLLACLGFVSLGLPDTVLGTAWPAMRREMGQPLDAAGLALLFTTAGVVLSSATAARVSARIGPAAVLVVSTALAALSLLGSAVAPSFAILVAWAFAAGLGGGAIDATLNDHVARHHSARAMSWLHGCWGVGASLGPACVAAVVHAGGSWRTAYAILGVAEVALVFAFVATRKVWIGAAAPRAGSHAPRAPAVRWKASAAYFFAYTGVEAGAGLWATSLLLETRGVSAARAGATTAIYWGALMAGRFVIGAAADAFAPARLLRVSGTLAIAALAVLSVPGTSAFTATAALAVLGLALAPIYPVAMHETPRLFGASAARVVGFQVAAASIGIAVTPWIIGAVARRTSLLVVPPCLLALAVVLAGLGELRRRPFSSRSPTEGPGVGPAPTPPPQ